MKSYDRPEEWLNCSQCHTYMLPLKDYEISRASEAPSAEAEWWEFLLFGWWVFAFNYVYGFFTFEGRKRKLAQQQAEILPEFPNSMICPRCLHVVKRP